MNKKTLLLVTGLVLTLSVAGCSNKKDTAETETAVNQLVLCRLHSGILQCSMLE